MQIKIKIISRMLNNQKVLYNIGPSILYLQMNRDKASLTSLSTGTLFLSNSKRLLLLLRLLLKLSLKSENSNNVNF
jgi:hypothetical protein